MASTYRALVEEYLNGIQPDRFTTGPNLGGDSVEDYKAEATRVKTAATAIRNAVEQDCLAIIEETEKEVQHKRKNELLHMMNSFLGEAAPGLNKANENADKILNETASQEDWPRVIQLARDGVAEVIEKVQSVHNYITIYSMVNRGAIVLGSKPQEDGANEDGLSQNEIIQTAVGQVISSLAKGESGGDDLIKKVVDQAIGALNIEDHENDPVIQKVILEVLNTLAEGDDAGEGAIQAAFEKVVAEHPEVAAENNEEDKKVVNQVEAPKQDEQNGQDVIDVQPDPVPPVPPVVQGSGEAKEDVEVVKPDAQANNLQQGSVPVKEEIKDHDTAYLWVDKVIKSKDYTAIEKIEIIRAKDIAPFNTLIKRLDAYQNVMGLDKVVEPSKGARANFDLYTYLVKQLKQNYSQCKPLLDVACIYFSETDIFTAFRHSAMTRFDMQWEFGRDTLKEYLQLITIISVLADLKERAKNRKRVSLVGSAIDRTVIDNITRYFEL